MTMANAVRHTVAFLLVVAALAAAPTAALRAVAPQRLAATAPAPEPPAFPAAYEMEWNFEMPYFMLLQPSGFKYKVRAWVDGASDSVRVDFNGGEQQAFFIKDKEYGVYYKKYTRYCREYAHGGGPVTAAGDAAGDAAGYAAAAAPPAWPLGTPVLPDLTTGDWEATGTAEVNGKVAVQWQLKRQQEGGEKIDTYLFYVTPEGVPLKLHSVGRDLFEGSHYDEYIYDFTYFKAGPVAPGAFKLPPICPTEEKGGERGAGAAAAAGAAAGKGGRQAERHHAAMEAAALLPGAVLGGRDRAHYFGFSRHLGRAHGGAEEYAARLATFAANKARIIAHNAAAARGGPGAPTHRLRLNRFADWGRAEFERTMLPNKWAADRGLAPDVGARPPPLEVFRPSLRRSDLPPHLDWRGTPADFAVKDQAQCGSCWAFATTGALEGAWFVQTGEGRSFSEQQLVDCAWEQGPHGCDGGDAQPAFAYVVAAGGISQTQDYPYKGLNGLCRDNATAKAGHFLGYGQVPSREESAVMEALMRHGPLAVGVDADFDFTFYSEGVYREKRCALKPSKLNHAVVLVGWGSGGGEDYWIVRNSWSKFWGQDGYIFVKRGGNDCGIASDAVYAKVSPSFAVDGAPQRALSMALANGRRAAAAAAAAAS